MSSPSLLSAPCPALLCRDANASNLHSAFQSAIASAGVGVASSSLYCASEWSCFAHCQTARTHAYSTPLTVLRTYTCSMWSGKMAGTGIQKYVVV